jgi:DNA-binding NtrC family response regulator
MSTGPQQLVGSSESFLAFRRDLERVAGTEVSVLLEGEHGTGKTSAARALHAASARKSGPLIEVDLSALSPSLLESELFGHLAGAFTGADGDRLGRFRKAEGGTLVLEGIEIVPLGLQVKLLRSLQERVIEPLGSEQSVPVDVRLVVTSSRDLSGEVAEGRFREDLFYRLAVVTLQLPPLRTREGDIVPLFESLAAGVASRAGVAPRPLSPAAAELLAAHPWPGNVRELENALERVMVFAPAGSAPIEAAELGFLNEAIDGAADRLAREALSQGLGLEELSNALLDAALAEERGNVSAAARRVGLSRRAFEYRRAKTEVDEE